MKSCTVATAFVLIVSAGALCVSAFDPKPASDVEAADNHFKAGNFSKAEKLYARIVAGNPSNYPATVRLGYLALLSNRLAEAQKWLEKARALKPSEPAVQTLLAEVCYRRDDFAAAASLLRAAGQESRARQLAGFKGRKPYQIEGPGDRTSLKFVMTDPLPLVKVRVNGGKEVNFFIDTGAAEVILDTEFAHELGVEQVGSEKGRFAGGKEASVGHARIDSLTLGDWVVKNVPVALLDTRRFSEPIFRGNRVDGVLGTVLFYHFLATLDYPSDELALRRKTRDNVTRVERAAPDKTVTIPMWMAGDHFMVAWGRIGGGPPVLLFVDTGAAGVGLVLAESAIKEAGIKLLENQASDGIGGGGKVRSVPFVVKELSLGDVHERNVRGAFHGPFPLEHTVGFRIAGIISHSFFRPYALTFDFDGMRLLVQRPS
jgi:predicted aspartyl protease